MHHLANSAGWGRKTVQIGRAFQCSGEEALFIIVGRGWDLFVCQRVDEFRLPSIWY